MPDFRGEIEEKAQKQVAFEPFLISYGEGCG